MSRYYELSPESTPTLQAPVPQLAQTPEVRAILDAIKEKTGTADTPWLKNIRFTPQTDKRLAAAEKIYVGNIGSDEVHCYFMMTTGIVHGNARLVLVYGMDNQKTLFIHQDAVPPVRFTAPFDQICACDRASTIAEKLRAFLKACFILKGLTIGSGCEWGKTNSKYLKMAIRSLEKAEAQEENLDQDEEDNAGEIGDEENEDILEAIHSTGLRISRTEDDNEAPIQHHRSILPHAANRKRPFGEYAAADLGGVLEEADEDRNPYSNHLHDNEYGRRLRRTQNPREPPTRLAFRQIHGSNGAGAEELSDIREELLAEYIEADNLRNKSVEHLSNCQTEKQELDDRLHELKKTLEKTQKSIEQVKNRRAVAEKEMKTTNDGIRSQDALLKDLRRQMSGEEGFQLAKRLSQAGDR